MEYFSNLKAKLIYVFRIPDAAHKDCLKIGEATFEDGDITLQPNSHPLNKAAKARIDQYTKTAGIHYELLHTEIAIFIRDGKLCGMNDKEVHEVLLRSGIKRKEFEHVSGANEWFCCDLETAKKAIRAVKEGRKALQWGGGFQPPTLKNDISEAGSLHPIEFRPEQEEAIVKTLKQFKKGSQMLWNAKMRFGKTLSALEVVRRKGDFRRVLILTHRPVVDDGWYEDFQKIFYDTPDFAYGSKNRGDSYRSLESRAKKGECRYVYFASMQDLRGSELVGGNFDKNNDIFSTPWDLIIVDEAHEGTQTELGKAVIRRLEASAPKVLRLSGTPFNLLDDFKEEEIYTWDYVMEQRAKAQWDIDHPGDHNPYAGLPRLNIYTYDLGRLMNEFADEDIAFNFREFFRTSGAEASSLRNSEPESSSLRQSLCYFNKNEDYNSSHGDLPHRDKSELVQYVTFRLADSLPQSKVQELKSLKHKFEIEHPKPWDEETTQEYYNLIGPTESKLLDNGYGECILAKPEVRKIVRDAIMHFDGTRYTVLAYVIMPNHVHLLLVPHAPFSLESILHSIKSFTANNINKVLHRESIVWQRESFDRFVRSEKDLDRIITYIEENPGAMPKSKYDLYVNEGLDIRRLEASAPRFVHDIRRLEASAPRFVHEQHVQRFLDLLTKTDEESMYPFANKRYREIFRHTLWMVPGVKSAKALSAMLKNHPVFGMFEIVNVAGDGDEEETNEEALRKVTKAIGPDPDKTRTITLSCGRLTTGVSVKPWTGVFMLSGSFNTAASAYMQTIFRVQTPATINGRVKEDCYVFDFAPDRTLKVLAETAKISTKAGKAGESDRKQLGEFLNFCPIISIEGSQMRQLNTENMLQQLKRVYVERVVQNGFEDGYLYNDELMKLTDVDIKEFDELKGIIGQTKAMGKTNDITVNDQGLTNEEYEEKGKLEKKKKRELTDEEKARLEELKKKKKVKEDAISILRGISIRMPLLIYGATITDEDKELTIDNFTSLVDPQSWEEFMPKGVSKQRFNAFKKYYDPDIFTAAAKHIRAMARAADRLSIEERIERIAAIFSTFRNPDKETVLTPWRVVNMHMSDCLGGYTFFNEDFTETIEEPRYVERYGAEASSLRTSNYGAEASSLRKSITEDIFAPDSHLLEINSKSGLYPLYLAYNIYRSRCKNEMWAPETLEQHQAIWDKAVAENIFVICKTPMAKAITRRTLLGFRKGKTNMWAPDDLINKIKNQPELFIRKVHDLVGKDVKIKAIVGNPPYQEEGESTRKAPIYHLFYDIAFKLSDKVSLITPGRFLFRVGQTPKDWMDKMLNDEHFTVVDYFQKSNEVFPTVDIKGGVAIGFRDTATDFGAIKFFSEFSELVSIMDKVKKHKDSTKGSFTELVSSQGIYRFSDFALTSIPQILTVQGKGTAAKITSNAFENLPDIFRNSETEIEGRSVGIIGRDNSQRVTKWIDSQYLQPCEYLDYYNVFVPEANGTGAIGEVLSTPVIGVPVIGHTDTFLSIGKFAVAEEASACLKYVKTKFARCMLGTLKATQHNPKDTWANVPMQDFTEGSDIDWSKSVADIDKQLYAKYDLSADEITFIESMIKPM